MSEKVEDVRIRRAEAADCAALHEIYSGSDAVAGTLQLPYPSTEAWRRRLGEPGPGDHYLVALAGERVVGIVGLHTWPERPRRRHAGSIGMTVHDDWRGRGIGKALLEAAIDLADNWLNLERLELEVYVDNAAAIRLYENAGFEREGTFSKYAFRAGEYVDVYAMARLRASRR